MIVRIPTEGQFRVDDSLLGQLNDFDNKLVALVDHGGEAEFAEVLRQMLDVVRGKGVRVADTELVGSTLVLPPADITFAEAQRLFTGEGLIPG